MTTTAAAVRLDLLRHCRLHAAGTPHELSRKDAALLAVLALDGSAPRDTLACMLWPDAGPLRARANLRQRRFRLARRAGGLLIEGDERLRLAGGIAHPAHDLDAQLLADTGALDGDWLAGLAFADCPEFEHWLTLARERWQVLRAQALARVASVLEAEGRLAPALAIAQRLAADDALSDHATRRLMRLHHLRGDLGAAIEAYRRFAERLGAELGELPDDETAALAARLRQGDSLPATPRPLPATLRRPPRLVGRESAWQALESAWREGAALLVEAAPGLGKSRLLGDFLHGRAGALFVAAQPGDAERPYALAARLLARLWFDPGAPWPGADTALPGWARRELAALLPELGDAPPQRLDALRLQRALQAALAPPARAALQVIALDDVQQADAATLELLPALCGDGLPRWWLAVRSGEQPAALARWLAASAPPRTVRLAPLDAPQLALLLADVAPQAAGPPDAAPALQRYTGGIPLFVLETLRSLAEGQQDLAALASGASTAAPTAAVAMVQARLQRLPEAARQLAGAAAVCDAPLSLADAATLLGGAPLDWAAAFDALQTTLWLDAAGGLHDLVRDALLARQPEALRRWLHGRAATWAAARGAAAAEQAPHWQAAGRPELAAPLWREAALAARRRARPQEETALWDRTIAAHEAAGQHDAAFAAWRESIEARLFVAGPQPVQPLTAALLARAADDSQRLDALLAHAGVLMLAGDIQAVRTHAEAAARLASQRRDAARALQAGQLQASALAHAQALPEALQVLDRIAALVSAAPQHQYAYLATRSWVLHRAGRLGECARVLARCIELSLAADDLLEACTSCSNMASLLVSLGRYSEALSTIERALALRDQLGPTQGVHAANVDLNHGHVLLGLGRVAEARAAFERAQQAFERVGGSGSQWAVLGANAMASAELLRGDIDAAAARLISPPAQTPAFVAARHHVLAARIARARGRDPGPALAEAEAVLGPAGDALQRIAVQAEHLLAWPDTRAAEAAAGLALLQAQAQAAEQFSNAARLGWLRVERLLAAGDTSAAAGLSRHLLGRGAAQPFDLMPQAMWRLAERALRAAGDRRRAAWAARRAQACQATGAVTPG